MENEFPPNSHAHKEERTKRRPENATPAKKEVVRIGTGKAIVRKRPLYKQFFDAFRPEDNKGYIEYVLLDVLAQGIKDAIADSAISGIENTLGANRRRGSRHGGGGGYTSYNRMSQARPRSRREREEDDRRPSRRESRSGPEHREIIVDSRVFAEETLDAAIELISKYDTVSMRDILSLVGEPWDYTDEDWGWRDLRGSRIHKVRDGYLIDLPRAEPLD